MAQTPSKKKLTIMVSSPVYGIEELLDRVFTLLSSLGYEVWMSHKGTVPVFSHRTAFENCLEAVEKCDLFLGIITPHYGSGQDKHAADSRSITHREISKAIELKKPRWLLAHDHVSFAYTLLNHLHMASDDTKKTFGGKEGRMRLVLQKSQMLNDLRVIELYEEAILSQRPLATREGNWVQKFRTTDDAALFTDAQFYRYQEVESFITENFPNRSVLSKGGQV